MSKFTRCLRATALFVAATIPTLAFAQPPKADEFEDGGFVYVAPGIAGFTFGGGPADAAEDLLELSYTTQIGGGYLFRRGNFMATLGGTAELMVYNFDEPGRIDADGVQFRLLPEVRLGGGRDWWFVYGVLKPGLAVSHVDWDYDHDHWDCGHGHAHWWCDEYDGSDFEDTAAGFDAGFGVGVTFKVWRGLGVGAESGFDLAFFPDDHPFERVFVADFIIYAGWWF